MCACIQTDNGVGGEVIESCDNCQDLARLDDQIEQLEAEQADQPTDLELCEVCGKTFPYTVDHQLASFPNTCSVKCAEATLEAE